MGISSIGMDPYAESLINSYDIGCVPDHFSNRKGRVTLIKERAANGCHAIQNKI